MLLVSIMLIPKTRGIRAREPYSSWSLFLSVYTGIEDEKNGLKRKRSFSVLFVSNQTFLRFVHELFVLHQDWQFIPDPHPATDSLTPKTE